MTTPSPDAAKAAPDDDIVDAEIVEQEADPAANSAAGLPSAAPESASPATASFGAGLSPAPAWSPPTVAFDYTDAGVPTLDYVRDKIDSRLGTAQGATELAEMAATRDRGGKPLPSAADVQAEREKAGRDRLEEIRKSLGNKG